MFKKIGISLLAMGLLLGGCAKKPSFIIDDEKKVAVIERPKVSEINKLSDLKSMIENELDSGKGFNYSETISANGASIFSFYTEDSFNHRRFRQSIVMGEESGLVKYVIEDDGEFSEYDVNSQKFTSTSSVELDNAASSVRLQLLDYLRDDLEMNITDQTDDELKIDVTGLEINDAGTVFNRMSITYLAADEGVVIFYLFSDSGTAMGFTISFVEDGYDIGESLKDVAAIEGE